MSFIGSCLGKLFFHKNAGWGNEFWLRTQMACRSERGAYAVWAIFVFVHDSDALIFLFLREIAATINAAYS